MKNIYYKTQNLRSKSSTSYNTTGVSIAPQGRIVRP